ncbi:MAG: DUF560 domain-containing protein [Rhodobacterales bacterium]|nr:DUF560 domain-containing protein [Rhodobacterales bacterium]
MLLLASGALAGPVEDALERGDATAARAALEAEIAGSADASIHRAHLEGLIAMRQGDLRAAERAFRSILASNPDFEPARIQLVIVLRKLDDPAAVREAKILAKTTKDSRLRETLTRALPKDRKSDKSGVQLRFAILPSSNITGGPTIDTVFIGGLPFALDPASQAASGTGMNIGVVAWQNWSLGPDWQLSLSGSLDKRLYDTALRPDETELGVRLNLAHKMKRGTLSFGPRFALLEQDGELARRQGGIGLEAVFLPGKNTRITFATELLRQTFPQAPYRDGTRARATLGFRWALRKDTELSLSIPILKETAEADHLAHRDLGVALGLQMQRGKLGVGITLATSRNRYDGVYPGFFASRDDTVSSVSLSVSHSDLNWKGMTPEFSITREHQSSNIPLHDSWTTDVGINFVKRF